MSEATKHGIKKLTDYQHARLKTEMYLGSRVPHTQSVLLFNENGPYIKETTWTPAAFTAFREALDNATDEVIGHKHGDKLWIDYDEAAKTISVKDNGRGIPIDFDKTHDMHVATMVLTQARAGRNFGDRGQVGGTNGLGIAVVAFCSEWFEVEIVTAGKRFNQRFSETMFDELGIDEPTIKAFKGETGTKVTFKLSDEVFNSNGNSLILPEEFISSRAYELSLVNPGVTVFYNGQKIKKPTYFNKNNSFEITLDEDMILPDGTKKHYFSKFIIAPNFVEEGDFVHSNVNNIPALNGGNHITAFRAIFTGQILDALEKEAKRKKLPINKHDVMESLLVFNITKMDAPNFDSQSKTRLINEDIAKAIWKFIAEPTIFQALVKKQRPWVDEIFARCEARTNKKDQEELDASQKKLAKKKIAKLVEANSKNRMDCVLVIAEGDSAISGLSAARDPLIHAGLPLRGKILNVTGEKPARVLKSEIVVDMISALGLQIGKKAVREELRYGKLYVAHDMDPDGFQIGALVVNILFTYWPELFEDKANPFVNIFMTPYIIARKGKENKYWYGDDYASFDPEKNKGWEITRAKGLSSLRPVDWKYSLQNPNLLPIVNDPDMAETLDLIFNGARADDRKNWMAE